MRVGVELGQPLWLLGLPIAAMLLFAARYPAWRAAQRLGGAAHRRELRRLALRFLWTAILILALADTKVIRYLPRQAVVLVEDVSASLTSDRDEIERAARLAAADARPGDLLGTVAAAAGAQV